LIDLSFALANTGLKALKSLLLDPQVSRVELADDPVFIIGHWRTGTTLLHELLALDPRHRCPTTFECFLPHHFLLTEPLLKGWSGFLLPRRRPPDRMQMDWNRTQEDEFALCNLGVPSFYATIAFPNHPPQWLQYLELEELSEAQRRRWQRAFLGFLKDLICKRPGRIVLKSPTHTFRLPLLRQMFPHARFIYMVRNPYAVFPSTVWLWKSLFWSEGYQRPHCLGLEELVFEIFIRMHCRLEATRGLIDPRRFYQLRYEDLVRDPLGQLRAVYEHLELGALDTVEPAIKAYLADRAGYQTNRYESTPQLRAEISRRWRPYIEQYGYE